MQSTAAYKDISEQYKAGGDLDKGIRAAASAITALAGGDPLKALAQGAAPYMAGAIRDLTLQDEKKTNYRTDRRERYRSCSCGWRSR
ncbi:hypothetical protein [Pectobacterium sp. CFBP8739]|uniref:hypothetical protein n=1 Tax=Pectobacterium sp. CFBP8739 TaxID=2748908 RepID=UPI0015E03885|nr:hypothetical protein [Pectobacterium sp. CFBP8739]MBA0169559.1 hypothetical protein [Pectobacterium sp. CFBP8739]